MRSAALRYGFAVVVVALAITLRYALMPVFEVGYVYTTIYPAIIMVAIFAGLGPAIFTGIAGSIAAEYFFTPAVELSDLPGVVIVFLTAVLAGWLARQLHKAMAKTEQQAKSLEDKTRELETIIGIVSHDLRAPLVNVRGFASEIGKDISAWRQKADKDPALAQALARLEPLFKSIRQSLDFITSSAEAMDKLAVSLVSVARAGLAAIHPEQVDMNEVMRKAVASIEFKFRQNNAAYDIDADLPPCFGDKTQITQIFQNLLDNAVKYLDPDRPGQICVGSRLERGHALYWVSDNGIGIALAEQERIFDPYYQLHEKAAEGVGLGLATVKRMVDRNGGRIWVDSEKGKGTTFYIALPIRAG